MVEYLKSTGLKAWNMGMVPLSGIDEPKRLQERVLKLAYDAPFDLIYLPIFLENVFEH